MTDLAADLTASTLRDGATVMLLRDAAGPQRRLGAIGRFPTVDALLTAVAAAEEPRGVDDGGGWRVLLPGDPGHPEPVAP